MPSTWKLICSANTSRSSSPCERQPEPGSGTPQVQPRLTLRVRGAGQQHLLRWHIVGHEVAPELRKCLRRNRRPHLCHGSQIHVCVMDAQHAQAEDFAHVEQVPQIRTREMPASKAIAAFLDWPEIRFAGAGLDAQAAAPCEGG